MASPIKDEVLKGCLEIYVEAENLANLDIHSLSDPFVVIDMYKTKGWVEMGSFTFTSSAFIVVLLTIHYALCRTHRDHMG